MDRARSPAQHRTRHARGCEPIAFLQAMLKRRCPESARRPRALSSQRNLVQTKLAPRAAGLSHEQWPKPPLGFVRVVRWALCRLADYAA